MFKRIATMALALLLIASLSSCIFDPKNTPDKKTPPIVYPPLTDKTAVLEWLSLSYNSRDIVRYKELLDQNDFVFFFSPGDYANGTTPESWGYQEEVTSATNMFNKGGGVNNNPILTITLDLVDFKNATWTEFDPEGQPGVYETSVDYIFSIDTENDKTYVTKGGERAQFRVRQDDKGLWHLIQWNDIADGV